MTTSPSNDHKLPIAETFTSIHGEGFWAGTRMTFFRTAGCNVGKVAPSGPFPLLPTGASATQCTSYDGRTFPCDTDYNKTEMVELDELIKRIPSGVQHVCVTGGEPFLHQTVLSRLSERLRKRRVKVHFETSGTIALPDWTQDGHTWIVCSPKNGYLKTNMGRVDEVRLMIDKNFQGDITVLNGIKPGCKVFLCPISDPSDVTKFDPESIQKCLELIAHPVLAEIDARISIQMHKLLNVR